jgi:HlyD family secretion protein
MSKRTIIVASVAAVIIAAAGAAYFRFWRAVPVTTVEAVQGRVALRVTGPGTIQARVPVTLSSRITATVARIDADVGDVVKRGQLLAVLDDRDLAARRAVAGGQQEILMRNLQAAQATVAKAQAELALAQSKHRRDSDLQRAGFLSPAALDTSVAALQSAQANLDNARALLAAREAEKLSLGHEVRYSDTVLSFTRITAPSDGVVIVRQTETGATVVPGSPIFRIADPATLWIAMRVDESVVGRVMVGQPAASGFVPEKLMPAKSRGLPASRMPRRANWKSTWHSTRRWNASPSTRKPRSRYSRARITESLCRWWR